MKQVTKKIIGFSFLLCLLMGLGWMQISQPIEAKKVKVKKVTVKAPYSKKMKLKVGQKAKLKVIVKVTPNKKTNKKVTYQSSKKKIVTVNKKGVVKAKKVGKAKITVISKKDKKKKTVIKVTVVKKTGNKIPQGKTPTPTPTPVPETKVNLQNAEVIHPRVIRLTFDQDVELTESNVTLMKKRNATAVKKYKLETYDIQKESGKSYLAFLTDNEKLENLDYVDVSVNHITGDVKEKSTRYVKPAETIVSNISLGGAVGEEVIETKAFGQINGFLKLIKTENIPEGIEVVTGGDDRYISFCGTYKKAGSYDAKVITEDELGNTFILNVHFGIYDENSISLAMPQDVYVTSTGEELRKLNLMCNCYGQSKNYSYEVAPNDWGIGIAESYGFYYVRGTFEKNGTYPITVTVTDNANPALTATKTINCHMEIGAPYSTMILDGAGQPVKEAKIDYYFKDVKSEYKNNFPDDYFSHCATSADTGAYQSNVLTGTYDMFVEREMSKQCYFVQNVRGGADGNIPDKILFDIHKVTLKTPEGKNCKGCAWKDEQGRILGYEDELYLKNGTYRLTNTPDEYVLGEKRKIQIAEFTVAGKEVTAVTRYEKMSDITITDIAPETSVQTELHGYHPVVYRFVPAETGIYRMDTLYEWGGDYCVKLYDEDFNSINGYIQSGNPAEPSMEGDTLEAGKTYYFAVRCDSYLKPDAQVNCVLRKIG